MQSSDSNESTFDAEAYHAGRATKAGDDGWLRTSGDEWHAHWCDHCRPFRIAIDTNVLLLLKTYLDMIALRKGPDAVPSSWLVLYLSIAIFVVAWFLQIAMLGSGGEGRLWPAFAGYLLELFFYGAVIYIFGFSHRIKQSMSAIIACGSIIAVASVFAIVLLSPLLGSDAARALGELFWYWSVPVKGHIVALAIQQHWFVGVTIAMAAFIMRIGVETAFAAQA